MLEVVFISQRTKTPLVLAVNSSSEMSILTDSMDTAGDVLQSLAGFLKIDDLNVQANFPADMSELADILSKVCKHYSYESMKLFSLVYSNLNRTRWTYQVKLREYPQQFF